SEYFVSMRVNNHGQVNPLLQPESDRSFTYCRKLERLRLLPEHDMSDCCAKAQRPQVTLPQAIRPVVDFWSRAVIKNRIARRSACKTADSAPTQSQNQLSH